MKVKRCKECDFFVSQNENREQSFGECVCNPPVIVQDGKKCAFPVVFSEQRCGKGVPKGVAGR